MSGERVAEAIADEATDPVYLNGEPLRAEKQFRLATHRICSPEETVERMGPLLAAAGITRVADITGLDRVGISVTQAIRPNGKSLSNSSGKGFTLAAATASAIMEGIEIHHAEECILEPFEATWRELDRQGLAIPLEDLPLAAFSLFHPDRPELWVTGFDLIGQRQLAVPYEIVILGRFVNLPKARGSFGGGGSNGLASGNHMLEAVCMGTAEVIERDATAISEMRCGGNYLQMPRYNLDTIPFPTVQDLLERLRSRGITPVLYDLTVDTGVPTVGCHLFDMGKVNAGMDVGYGTHLDPEIAMVRALTEAVQGRAIYIAGSRDDVTSLEYKRLFRLPPRHLLPAAGANGTIDASQLSSRAAPTFEEDCRTLLNALVQAGIEYAVVCDLTRPEFGVPVVHMIIPQLEPAHDNPTWVPGPRALAALAECN